MLWVVRCSMPCRLWSFFAWTQYDFHVANEPLLPVLHGGVHQRRASCSEERGWGEKREKKGPLLLSLHFLSSAWRFSSASFFYVIIKFMYISIKLSPRLWRLWLGCECSAVVTWMDGWNDKNSKLWNFPPKLNNFSISSHCFDKVHVCLSKPAIRSLSWGINFDDRQDKQFVALLFSYYLPRSSE